MKIKLILILTFEAICLSSSQPSYFDAAIGKCDGLFSLDFGSIVFNKTEFLIKEVQSTVKATCDWICGREEKDCWMIEYLSESCRLYKSKDYTVGGQTAIEFWKCPKPSCTKLPGRCLGYWVGYDKYVPTSIDLVPIKQILNVSKRYCLDTCESDHKCGSISFSFDNLQPPTTPGTCTLLFGYLPTLHEKVSVENVESVTLRCCPDLSSFSIPRKTNRIVGNLSEVLVGEWNLITTPFNMSMFTNEMISAFPCLDFDICIETCSKEPFCETPVYHINNVPICYMKLNPEIGNYKENSFPNISSSDMYLWKWTTDEDATKKVQTKKEPQFCICFEKSNKINIKTEFCSKYETIDVSSTLSLFTKKPLKKIVTEDNKINLVVNDGKRKYDLILDQSPENHFCDNSKCERYSELIYNEDTQVFVNREEWLAAPPKEKNVLQLPVDMLIIHNTYTPFGRCFTRALCSSFVKGFQIFHVSKRQFSDIAYNFLIGEDGNIYEGRGWTLMGSHTKGYNSMSIGVAFIGWFEDVEPNEKALVALRNLIEYGIRKNYLKSNFTLTTNRALRGSENPGQRLCQIISAWKLINLSKMEDCSTDQFLLYYIYIIVFSITFAFLLFLVSHYIRNRTYRVWSKVIQKACTPVNLQTEWCENPRESIKVEMINIKTDWIYFCEEVGKEDSNCECFLQIYALWIFCFIHENINFLERLFDILNTLNCGNAIYVYLDSQNSSILNPKQVILFHTRKMTKEQRNGYFSLLKENKFNIRNNFKIQRMPKESHEETAQYVTRYLHSLSDDDCK